MRTLLSLVPLALMAAGGVADESDTGSKAPARKESTAKRPVLVELFTSQG